MRGAIRQIVPRSATSSQRRLRSIANLILFFRAGDRHHENDADIAMPEGLSFPREIISYAVNAYHRFALSTADVEDLLAERGLVVSRESIRQ